MAQISKALVAAAKRITSLPKRAAKSEGVAAPTSKVDDTGWQDRAWEMYDLVGEYQTIVTKIASKVSRARLYVAVQNDDGELEEVEVPELAGLLAPFGRSRGGRSQLVRRMAANLYVAGECWFVGIPRDVLDGTRGQEAGSDIFSTPTYLDPLADPSDRVRDGHGPYGDDDEFEPLPGEDAEGYRWYVLSVREVKLNDREGTVELQLPEGKLTAQVDDIWLVRQHEPHPNLFEAADSPTRSALPILEELVGLTMHVAAQVDSRLAGAGVLVVDQKITAAMRAELQLEDDNTASPFVDALIDAMTTPIADRASASAIVPLVVEKPEGADVPEHLTFSTPLDAEARALREEALQRLAHSQDAPPELLLGTGGMNHWGAWLSSEETVESHIEPRLEAICHALTEQFLWPMAQAKGIQDPGRLVIWYDVAHLLAKPNRSGEALSLFKAGAISAKTLREVHGFSDVDAPETSAKADPAVVQAFEMLAVAPTLIAKPGLASLIAQIRQANDGTPIPEELDPAKGGGEGGVGGESPEGGSTEGEGDDEEPGVSKVPRTIGEQMDPDLPGGAG